MEKFDSSVGVAFLHMNLPDGTHATDCFQESEDDEYDPYHRAQRLRDAVRCDFPNAIFSIGANTRARLLAQVTQMRRVGFLDYTMSDAIEDDESGEMK